jgi:hypothetical protein
MGAAEAHAGVNVLGAGVPGLEHPDRRQQVGNDQSVDQEP